MDDFALNLSDKLAELYDNLVLEDIEFLDSVTGTLENLGIKFGATFSIDDTTTNLMKLRVLFYANLKDMSIRQLYEIGKFHNEVKVIMST